MKTLLRAEYVRGLSRSPNPLHGTLETNPGCWIALIPVCNFILDLGSQFLEFSFFRHLFRTAWEVLFAEKMIRVTGATESES